MGNEVKMVTRIRHNLFHLINRLEAQQERRIPLSEIAIATGLSEAGVRRATKNEYGGVQFDTISKLMDYFNAAGLNVGIEDMFTVERIPAGERLPARVARNGDQNPARLQPV
jgi:DNA-binding phage protein